MSSLFSKQCDYAIQALLYLALKPPGTMTSIKDLTGALKLPYHFVAKILQRLTRKGLVASLKGPTGGFTLGPPAEKITLLEVVDAVDGTVSLDSCLLGFAECTSNHPCGAHKEWQKVRTSTKSLLANQTIAEMAGKTRKPQYNAVR
ncbi:MAG TPA: Rrf2 family transcriptional regulator [Bacteroidota bacterium]|nr:Rrf2 family transcriptional regulator [Bacteroidota bacterium]